MPLCEAFGSVNPLNNQCETYNQLSVHMAFSAAFLFLLRLWKFYRPPVEWGSKGGEGVIGGELSLEYLLLLRNGRIRSAVVNSSQDEMPMELDQGSPELDKPIYIDFFPKLRAWYCQNRSCVASPLSTLSTGDPVQQVADRIINMIYSKMTSVPSSGNSSSSSSCVHGSPPTAGEPSQRPLLPAWELLEAIPFALESLLTACAYGRLSSRDLITGLVSLFLNLFLNFLFFLPMWTLFTLCNHCFCSFYGPPLFNEFNKTHWRNFWRYYKLTWNSLWNYMCGHHELSLLLPYAMC